MADRLDLNEPGDWLGPDYAIGLVDELVLSNAVVHLEMTSDVSAYLVANSPHREVFLRLHARPTTRAERRQVLAHSHDRLRDHLAGLIPRWLGGRTWWSIPWWQRPADAVRSWWDARKAARAVLCVEVEEDDEFDPG